EVGVLLERQGRARARLHAPLGARHGAPDRRMGGRARLRHREAPARAPAPSVAEAGHVMIVIAGTVRIRPERRDDAIRHALAMAEASRAEAGCVAYRFS